MIQANKFPILAGFLAVILVSGCASNPSAKTSLTKEQILEQPDVKNHQPNVYAKPLEEVRTAGLRALTFVGCEINAQEPFFLSGHRPNKFGLFVGSGGETVKIFLYPQSDSETHVWVDTDLSFVGLAGQQGWNKQVFAKMDEILGAPVSAPVLK